MLFRLFLISCFTSSFFHFSIGSHAAGTAKVTRSESFFLQKPVNSNIRFSDHPENLAKDQAAKFLNTALTTAPKNYQSLLNKLILQDKKLASDPEIAILPGSFLNTAADLYASIPLSLSIFPLVSTSDQTSEKIAQEQQLLTFASLLHKEAIILNSISNPLEQRLKAFESALAEAKNQGNLPSKVYIYSDSAAEQGRYEEVVRRYYPDPKARLHYNIVPPTYDPLYIDTLTIAAAALDGLVFFDRLPLSYPPFWASEWRPFFSAFPEESHIYAGWYGDWEDRSHDLRNFVHHDNDFLDRPYFNHFDEKRVFKTQRIKPFHKGKSHNTNSAFLHSMHNAAHAFHPHTSTGVTHPSLNQPRPKQIRPHRDQIHRLHRRQQAIVRVPHSHGEGHRHQ